VRKVFVDLYRRGLIYRGDYMINWCPRCHTALSDIEVEHEDEASTITHIRYPLAGGEGSIVVATTRPETMLGDSGVAVHPTISVTAPWSVRLLSYLCLIVQFQLSLMTMLILSLAAVR
jgi:isoleucyl-tRNA synthetase